MLFLFFQVTCLQEFFTDETTFLAYGAEKYSLDDFDLDDNGSFTSHYM